MQNSPQNAKSSESSCCGPNCCGGASNETTPSVKSADDIRSTVRAGYAHIANSGSWSAAQAVKVPTPTASGCCGSSSGGGCCGPSTFTPDQLAQAIGYSQSDLAVVPDSANMGLSCGNPTALAALKPGESVLDLGAGGGFDCFIAGAKVGAAGRVYGVDMTPEMLSKARANIQHYTKQTGLTNVEFRLGEIENIPLADSSVDVVISNCVLNLSPDQPRVWQEIARVLRPGGRVAISDLVLLRPLPASIRADVEALVGCVAGASLTSLIEQYARRAGLKDIKITRKGDYIDAMTDWQDPLYKAIIARLGPGEKLGTFVTSAEITATK
jgi:SAM-dependent methyltransferase